MLIIKEIWVNVRDDSEDNSDALSPDWMPMKVIKLVEAEIADTTIEGKSVVVSRTHFLCFHEKTGELGELDFRSVYAKQIYNNESKETYDFGAPEESDREESW